MVSSAPKSIFHPLQCQFLLVSRSPISFHPLFASYYPDTWSLLPFKSKPAHYSLRTAPFQLPNPARKNNPATIRYESSRQKRKNKRKKKEMRKNQRQWLYALARIRTRAQQFVDLNGISRTGHMATNNGTSRQLRISRWPACAKHHR